MASEIKRKNWVANFNLIGEARINEEKTFQIDERSSKSDWIYNRMSLGVDCGEKHGIIYPEMMGGYGENRNNKIYTHGKKTDGTDDYNKRIIVDWEDRFDEGILEDCGKGAFIEVGLEKTENGKTFIKRFLSSYDAIAYIKEHLKSGMIVNVKGNLKYSMYDGNTQVKKEITSIFLSKVNDKSNFKATFTQSIILDKDSASLKNIDKDKSVIYVNARVLDYVKEVDGVEVKGQFPLNKEFEFPMDFSNEERCEAVMNRLFKVKKDYTQVNFEGEFIEGGAVITATESDLTDDIKGLIEIGIYTKEEALAKCSKGGGKEQRMVLLKPVVKMVGDENEKRPDVQVFEGMYSEDELVVDLSIKKEIPKAEDSEEKPNSGDDWLNTLPFK